MAGGGRKSTGAQETLNYMNCGNFELFDLGNHHAVRSDFRDEGRKSWRFGE